MILLGLNIFSHFFLDHDYSGYQTNYDHTYQDLAAYQGYDQGGVASAFNSIAEKQDDLDMDVSFIFKFY